MPIPAARSDAVAEAALGAVAMLLGRVALANPEQLTGLLQRLLPIVTLPRTAAAEEVSTLHCKVFIQDQTCIRCIW